MDKQFRENRAGSSKDLDELLDDIAYEEIVEGLLALQWEGLIEPYDGGYRLTALGWEVANEMGLDEETR